MKQLFDMVLRAKRRNSKSGRKRLLSVKVQSQQARRERLRWLRLVGLSAFHMAPLCDVEGSRSTRSAAYTPGTTS